MMRSIKIQEGQTLTDVAMQYCGDALRVFEVAELNGLSITDEPLPGTWLYVPEATIENIKIVEAFEGLVPASKDDEDVLEMKFDGIDYWIIEEDFVVQEG